MAKVSKKRWLPWIMILPVILIRGITTVYPVFMTFINSFRNLNVIQGGKGEFIGLQNYARMLSDEKIATSLGFTLIFTMVSMIFHIILGIVLALILNMKFKGKKFLRTIVLIPWAMPMIVAGRAARWGFNGQYGFVNDLIGRFVENFHYDWLIDVDSARIAVIIVDLWKDIPYFAILVLAALQYISGDIYEAAKIDGANAVRAFFSITLPNIAKTVLSISICITKISTFLILCDLAVCLATLYVSFSLVFALMRYLQGKVFLIRFYSPTTLSSSRAEFRLPSRLACA